MLIQEQLLKNINDDNQTRHSEIKLLLALFPYSNEKQRNFPPLRFTYQICSVLKCNELLFYCSVLLTAAQKKFLKIIPLTF